MRVRCSNINFILDNGSQIVISRPRKNFFCMDALNVADPSFSCAGGAGGRRLLSVKRLMASLTLRHLRRDCCQNSVARRLFLDCQRFPSCCVTMVSNTLLAQYPYLFGRWDVVVSGSRFGLAMTHQNGRRSAQIIIIDLARQLLFGEKCHVGRLKPRER